MLHLVAKQRPLKRARAALLLGAGLLATTGCISTHVVKNKAQAHEEYSLEEQQLKAVQGDPKYYALLPLTVVGDAATSPFQIMYFLVTDDSHWGSIYIHGVPIPLP